MKVKPLHLVPRSTSFLAADGSGTSWGKLLSQCFGLDEHAPLHPDLMTISREFILTSPAVMSHFGTVILLDEIASRTLTNGQNAVAYLRAQGICTIVKSDGGLVPYYSNISGEELGQVRNGLPKWCEKMAGLGVVGTKHRTVYKLDASNKLIEAATDSQVQNAATVLSFDMVPCIEPEVMGGHGGSISQHAATSARVLDSVYAGCNDVSLDLSNTCLKISFVANGQKTLHSTPEEVGTATVDLIERHVPKEVPLVVFLSGGWAPERYYPYLNATVQEAKRRRLPQAIRASASRAVFEDSYRAWGNKWENIYKALQVMSLRALATTAAVEGRYSPLQEVAIQSIVKN